MITFNEIMYHPALTDAALEWIELYNQMSVDMDISGWEITGADFRFPTNTIFAADSYLVIAAAPDRLRARGVTNAFGPFKGRISSSGERIRLRNPSGRLMDEITYSDEDPWPVGADGSGASLSKKGRFNASSPAANWRASLEPGGTPGKINFPETGKSEPLTFPLITAGSAARWIVPTNNALASDWTPASFDDSAWSPGSAAIGYDTGSTAPVELRNVALNKTVIDGSGSYYGNPFNVPDGVGNFTAQNVTDGSVEDIFGVNYWLGREGTLNEYFTLDLGQSFSIEEIHLRNTHNTQHNDRGTGQFEIWASQTIDATKKLVNPSRILSGTLSQVWGLAPIPADIFTTTNGLTPANARYLKFVALTANNALNAVGLNEIEVHAPAFAGPDRAYSFDGNFNDSSGGGFNAVNSGAQFSTDIPSVFSSGHSIQFDGITSEVQILDSLNPTSYTIALWVNVETVQSSSIVVRTDANGVRSAWSHQLRINGSGRFEHYIFDGTGRSVAATNNIVPGQWYHITLTATNAGTMRIFVNGVQSGPANAINNLWSGGNQWRLGTDAGNAPNHFKGKLDELAIWHSVLTSDEIAALAAGRKPGQLGGYRRYFTTDVETPLYNKNSSLFLRIPFEAPNAAPLAELTLRARYADGFVAFLNGVEVARRNAPQTLAWNSSATQNRSDADAINFETIDLSAYVSRVTEGQNVLAIQPLNFTASEPAFIFSAELTGRPAQFESVTNVAFNEIGAATNASFFVELQNSGPAQAVLDGCKIQSSSGGVYTLANASLAPGAFLTINANTLGFVVQDGERLFLLGRGGELIDGVEIHNRTRGRKTAATDAPWFYTSVDTPDQSNSIPAHGEIVINEIMYHHPPVYRNGAVPDSENDEQWIELYNRSGSTVDLSGWRLDGEVAFVFPTGTAMGADSFLVVAKDAAALRVKYPDITIVGNFEGRLSHHSADIILRDSSENPADEVRYHNSHPWPEYANGGGSSLELRDPRANNSVPESWGASDESSKTSWRRYTYRSRAVQPVYSPGIFSFHEFRIGLLDEGEALFDNITVTEFPTGAPRQLLQNTNFTTGTTFWRLLGNHSHSFVEARPDSPGDNALHLVATGNTSYLDNRLETTLKVGSTLVPVVTGRDYEISFDAKWIGGSPQVHTELYYNKVAATTILDTPTLLGTPGRRNSIYVANAGPTFSGLTHSPIIPKASESIQVIINAEDPDSVSAMRLFYSVNGGAWRDVAMIASQPGYNGVIPGQTSAAVIQFYVQGTDASGAVSTYPRRGPASRALIKVDSVRTVAGKQTFRTIMTPADSALLHNAINMMSDDLLGCTAIHNETEVFYDAKIRLHGSMFSRSQPDLTGMTIKFPADHLFRGSRESVIVRRRGLVETFVKHILNAAGGIPGNYDDIVNLVSHRSDNFGTARMNLANYDDTYVDSQFEGDNDGTVFKLEGIREYQTTQNGSPEGLKLSQPIGWIQTFDIANLGADQEQYRWGIMIQNQRQRDDYSRIVNLGKTFSLTGAALKTAATDAIDVDEWARLFALQNLLGIGDVYGVENPHNFAMYVRPSDGRVVGLQNDWEFAFALDSGASIYGSKNVYKVLAVPGFRRLYQGHILDLLDSVVNSAYLTPWARHYTTKAGENYNNVPSYAASRGTSARAQLAARIPFEITSNSGADYTVVTPTVTLEGRAWIDVHKIFRNGDSLPLKLTWLDDQRWQTVLPLNNGTNRIDLTGVNFRGVTVGQDSINIISTASDFPQRDYLRIAEVMYHPAPPTARESSAGFTADSDFEFVELINRGPVSVSLKGARFTLGIEFDFTSSAITNLVPNERVLVAANRTALEFRYATNLPLAGEYSGALSDGGETLRLVDELGRIIHEFTYDDNNGWPASADGGGRSLEVINLSGNYNDPANWRPSPTLGGTPGPFQIPTPAFSAVTITAGQMVLSFQAEPMRGYSIEACSDLANPAWFRLRQFAPRDLSRIEQIIETIDGNARFYRLVSF